MKCSNSGRFSPGKAASVFLSDQLQQQGVAKCRSPRPLSVTSTHLVISLCFCALSCILPLPVRGQTIQILLERQANVTEFSRQLQQSDIAKALLKVRQETIFAPCDNELRKHGRLDDDTLLYHLSNGAQTSDLLEYSLATESSQNSPLWITKKFDNPGAGGLGRHPQYASVTGGRSGNCDWDGRTPDIYINNARLIRRDIRGKADNNRDQVVHVVDRVLVPTLPERSGDYSLLNPDARKVLSNYTQYKLGENNRLGNFLQQVVRNNKLDVFAASGKFTFLIPVDQGFKKQARRDVIDSKIIDAHVIPDHVLFTRATDYDNEYKSLAFSDMLEVGIGFVNLTSRQAGTKLYIRSNTHVGDSSHPRGGTLAEIVKSDIPVKNGVIHLISKPLTVIDSYVNEILQDEKLGQLSHFYRYLEEYGKDIINYIISKEDVTIFAPSNGAFDQLNENPFWSQIKQDRLKMGQILKMHVVRQRLLTADLYNKKGISKEETMIPGQKLFFSAIVTDHNRTITVDGAGVTAKIMVPDIGAVNGVVHIIDKVMGMPLFTVGAKVKEDFLLRKMYDLGNITNFNNELYKPERRLTYFVPNDEAWTLVDKTMGMAYDKLFSGRHTFQARQILERHLHPNGQYKMDELARRYCSGAKLQMVIGELSICPSRDGSTQSSKAYRIAWDGIEARVVRPDVQCTNGIVHIIDRVLMRHNDVAIGGADSVASASVSILAVLTPLLITHLLLV